MADTDKDFDDEDAAGVMEQIAIAYQATTTVMQPLFWRSISKHWGSCDNCQKAV